MRWFFFQPPRRARQVAQAAFYAVLSDALCVCICAICGVLFFRVHTALEFEFLFLLSVEASEQAHSC